MCIKNQISSRSSMHIRITLRAHHNSNGIAVIELHIANLRDAKKGVLQWRAAWRRRRSLLYILIRVLLHISILGNVRYMQLHSVAKQFHNIVYEGCKVYTYIYAKLVAVAFICHIKSSTVRTAHTEKDTFNHTHKLQI